MGNRIGVGLHRVARGRLDAFGDQKVLMITSPGRRTGLPRSTMVRYLDHEDGYVVWGTASGALDVVAHELTGAERDRVWRDVVLARAPGVARYALKAGRVIPVAYLRPERPA